MLKQNIFRPCKELIHNFMRKAAHLPFIKLFAFFFTEIMGGYRIYKALLKKYGEDTIFLTCQHPGTGDVYNIGTYFQQYLQKNGIKKYEFLFRGEREQKVGALFGIHGDTVLSSRETECLMRFARFAHAPNVEVTQLHHMDFLYEASTNFSYFEEYYKGITFVDTFKKVTMGLDDNARPEPPHFCKVENIDKIFEAKGLKKGRTVILSPYSSSAQVLTEDIWNALIEKLKAAGFTVATNCAPGEERPLSGTAAVSFEYQYAKSYMERAGYFVGARSGLCDIINTTSCKKIVLTPYWSPFLVWLGTPGKSMRFYGMWPNYKREDTAEIEYDDKTVGEVPGKVIDLLKNPGSWQREIKLVRQES